MPNFNRVILAGNVTRDIELRYTQGGTAVCDIGLAINEKYKDGSGELVESTVFVDVTLWGRTAEIAGEYLSKGAPCLIEGRLKLDQWEDRESGGKRSKLKVVGEKLQLLSNKQGGGSGGGRQRTEDEYSQEPPPARRPPQSAPEPAYSPPAPATFNDDDIPF